MLHTAGTHTAEQRGPHRRMTASRIPRTLELARDGAVAQRELVDELYGRIVGAQKGSHLVER